MRRAGRFSRQEFDESQACPRAVIASTANPALSQSSHLLAVELGAAIAADRNQLAPPANKNGSAAFGGSLALTTSVAPPSVYGPVYFSSF
jgi:hypothetical protein